jgi:hypothetical protein
MTTETKAKKFLRYIAKIKGREIPDGKGGKTTAYRIDLDNVSDKNNDGTPNTYHNGVLLWVEAETGKTYQVKQLELRGVSEGDASRGAINSVAIALEDSYAVNLLE